MKTTFSKRTWYTIENKKDNETYHQTFKNDEEARNWVVNHLDLSKNWDVLRIKRPN